MNLLEIAGLRFGEGAPKICVPLMGQDVLSLRMEARTVRGLGADLFEWRADHFRGSYAQALEILAAELSPTPLLCTLRTEQEGGQARLTPEEYEKAVEELLELPGFQLIDVEMARGPEMVRRLGEKAHQRKLALVISKHDFACTWPQYVIVETLLDMKKLGAELPKVAVTPSGPEDVLALMAATLQASREIGPVITMSMGDMGKLSRVSGELTGSCLTFAAGQSPSAPGQINAEDLRAILEDLSYAQLAHSQLAHST